MALLLMALLSLLVSIDRTLSLPSFGLLLLDIGICYAATYLASTRRRYWIGISLLIACIVGVSLGSLTGTAWDTDKYPGLLGVYRVIRSLEGRQSLDSIPGDMNAATVGGLLAVLLPIALALVSHGRLARATTALLAVVTLIGLGVFVLSGSRTAFLGFGAALFVLLAFRWPKFALALLLTGSAGLIIALILDGNLGHLLVNADLATVARGDTSTLESRFGMWIRIVRVLADYPFTGTGLHTLALATNTFYPLPVGDCPCKLVPYAHSIYLQVTSDFGLAGLVAFLGLWTSVIICGWKAYRQLNPNDLGTATLRATIAGLLAGVAAYLVFGIGDVITWEVEPTTILWLMAGLVVAAQRLGQPHCPSGESHVTGRRALRVAKTTARRTYWAADYLLVGLGYAAFGLASLKMLLR